MKLKSIPYRLMNGSMVRIITSGETVDHRGKLVFLSEGGIKYYSWGHNPQFPVQVDGANKIRERE